MSEKELNQYMKKQSMKTLKGLEEFYNEQIIDLEMNGEEGRGERAILEALKFEIMVRNLKKVTRQLNRNPHLCEVNDCKNRENERPL